MSAEYKPGKAFALSQKVYADQSTVSALEACHALDPGDMEICKDLAAEKEILAKSSEKFSTYMKY